MSHAQVAIRPCTLADAETIIYLGVKSFTDTFAKDNTEENLRLYLQSTYTIAKISSDLNDPNSVYFIAELGGLACGFAKVRAGENPPEFAGKRALEIERLYTLQDVLGKGVGAELMNTCLAYAEQNKFQVVWLGVWEHNERAKRFYKKYGFERFGQHVFMVGYDAQTDHLMKKNL